MKRRDESGVVMVELALILPILLMLVVGIIQFGQAYNIQISVQAAAREGARALALHKAPGPAVASAAPSATIASSSACPSSGEATATITVTQNYTFSIPFVRVARHEDVDRHGGDEVRVIPRDGRDEHGIVLVWVALMMVVFLGAGALVIDVGAFRREERELQNGADAGALAVAQDCAQLPSCGGGAVSLAQTFANSNAHDSTSAVGGVCGSGGGLSACATSPVVPAGATGWVQVSTSTRTSGGGSEVEFVLAPLAGAISGKTANASAIAAWGAAGAANTPPLAFAQCAYNTSVPGGSLPSAPTTLYFHNPTNETYSEACTTATTPPGGFGWIRDGRMLRPDLCHRRRPVGPRQRWGRPIRLLRPGRGHRHVSARRHRPHRHLQRVLDPDWKWRRGECHLPTGGHSGLRDHELPVHGSSKPGRVQLPDHE